MSIPQERLEKAGERFDDLDNDQHKQQRPKLKNATVLDKDFTKMKDKSIEKTKKMSPPFDSFGISPQFYINGDTSVVSWVGFFCTLAQIAITVIVIVFFTRGFVRKEEANITILNLKTEDQPFINLKDNR